MTTTANTTVTDEGTFAAPGATLYRASVRPAGAAAPARARLAIVHGYGDHAGRYAEFMTHLAERGVACHAFDQRGHGRSTGARGFVRNWDEYLDDLGAFLALPELGDRPEPLFLLGHSHGGLIAAAAGVRGVLPPRVAGCVLSAPYLVNCLAVPRVKAAAARVLNVVAPWLRVRSGVSPRMMSGDARQVEESRRDPLLLRSATPRWFLTHRPVQAEALARAGEFRLPLLVLCGDADPIADPRGAAAFHAGAGSRDKSLVVYPGFKHEPLREDGRERVFGDVLAWIEGRARI
jgi:lysophospholipase